MARRNKLTAIRNRRRLNRCRKSNDDDSFDFEVSTEIREIFDQMDIIYAELEGKLCKLKASTVKSYSRVCRKYLTPELAVNSNDSFTYQYHSDDLNELDTSLDFIYEQIGKWLVGYCGCLVQREQLGIFDAECLENLLDKLLGICYQLDSWCELAQSLIHDVGKTFEVESKDDVPSKDLNELDRRLRRVRRVQIYLSQIKQKHADKLVTTDRRPFSQMNSQEKEKLAFRFSRFIKASFPSTSVERLHEVIGKVAIDQIPQFLHAC